MPCENPRTKKNTTFPDSICSYSYCKKYKMARVVDFFARKPYIVVYARSNYFPSNQTAVSTLITQKSF